MGLTRTPTFMLHVMWSGSDAYADDWFSDETAPLTSVASVALPYRDCRKPPSRRLDWLRVHSSCGCTLSLADESGGQMCKE